MNLNDFRDALYRIQGQTIAVVYIFEGECGKGFEHYDIWKSDVISEWLTAIQQNYCKPLIMDVRTFIQKAMNSTLPHIDFVLNLNAGNKSLSTLSLVPSVCSFLNIPCIPCDSISIMAGENKQFSNIFANYIGLQIPENIEGNEYGIFRPLCYGSSRGIIKGTDLNMNLESGIYQKFIKGYDITTPILYNPISEKLEILPTVMYYSEDKDIEWYFNEKVKEKREGYKKAILQIDRITEKYYIELARQININCYCRIDARVKCDSKQEWDELLSSPIPNSKIFFIEINPMPTLKNNINIHNSLNSLNTENTFYEIYNEYNNFHKTICPTGFILLCSMLSYLKPSVKEKRINTILTNKI